MANNLTNWGEEVMLIGDGADGGIARIASDIRLYLNTSVPARDGTGFNEIPNGNGYVTGGEAVVLGNWALSLAGDVNQIVLTTDPSWTASGGPISNIAGAYLTDGTDPMAWWERTALTLAIGETLTLDDITIRL